MQGALRSGSLELPLLRNPNLRISSRDPQAWAQRIRSTIPVRICEPLRLNRPFRNHTAIAPVGKLLLVAVQGSPIAIQTDHHQAAQLVLPYRGSGTWRVDGQPFTNPVGESVLFLPPAPLTLENDITSGVGINIAPADLLHTALTMAGPEGIDGDLAQLLQQPQRLLVQDPGVRPLVDCLYRTLSTADQALRAAPLALPLLGLDDLLIRLTLLLLVPSLRQGAKGHPDSTRGNSNTHTTLGHLTDWIDDNLHQAIGLTDLERASGYSRRNLQYSFKTHYGCTPMQWVKQRRLYHALQRLEHPELTDTVWSVAQSHGYSNLAAFSRDFKAKHGRTASEVLRGGRSSH